MSYLVELTPLKVITPSPESLDEETKNALMAYRLGFGVRDDMCRYYEKVRNEMQPVTEYESDIWEAFLPEEISEPGFTEYTKTVPIQVLEHYKEARDTLAFYEFRIWMERESSGWGDKREHGLQILAAFGYRDFCPPGLDESPFSPYFILAKWQPMSEAPVTLDLVKRWIREGLYPKAKRSLSGLTLEQTVEKQRKEYNYCCDQHDYLISKQAA